MSNLTGYTIIYKDGGHRSFQTIEALEDWLAVGRNMEYTICEGMLGNILTIEKESKVKITNIRVKRLTWNR